MVKGRSSLLFSRSPPAGLVFRLLVSHQLHNDFQRIISRFVAGFFIPPQHVADALCFPVVRPSLRLSVRLSVVCRLDISLRIGGISMKLATDIRHVIGHR